MAEPHKNRNLVVPGAVLAVLVAGIVACSGNKSFVPSTYPNMSRETGAPVYNMTGGMVPNKTATAVLNLVVPAHPAVSAAPDILSPATQGVKITVTQSGIKPQSQFLALTAGKSYCKGGNPTHPLKCQIVFSVPAGKDTFNINTYAGTTPNSQQLAGGRLSEKIAAGTEKTLGISLGGIPAFLQMALDNPFPAAGASTSVPIELTVADAWGYVIVGTYQSAVTLTDSDGKATSLSKSSIANSNQADALKLLYDGKALTSATITASIPGVSTKVTFQPGGKGIVPNPPLLRVAYKALATHLTLGGPGAIGPFIVTTTPDTAGNPACKGMATVTGSGKSYKVAASGALGVCWLVAKDQSGHKASIPVLVSAYPWQSPGPSPTPVPSGPTPTPSPTPTPAIAPVQVNPGTITICPQFGQHSCKPFAGTVTIKQSNTPGIFIESDNCSASYVKFKLINPTGVVRYKLIGQSSTGSCQATFTGFGGKKGTLTIDVQGSGIIINTKTRMGSGQKEPRKS